MIDLTVRLFWLAVLSVSLAYVFFLLFGSLFTVERPSTVLIEDMLARGQHTVSGMVMLPTPCAELSVKTNKLSPTIYTLELRTWQDPAVRCPKSETPREFNTVAFAPSFGVQFLVMLDGRSVPYHITPVITEKKL